MYFHIKGENNGKALTIPEDILTDIEVEKQKFLQEEKSGISECSTELPMSAKFWVKECVKREFYSYSFFSKNIKEIGIHFQAHITQGT